MNQRQSEAIVSFAEALAGSEALLIGAGAGMGVDSGLPDFRGTEGFWKAYPPLARLGIRFEEMANPRWFRSDPCLAWGFYGHRLGLYRKTRPHDGFSILLKWIEELGLFSFVYTSNVDGHFQEAGFSDGEIYECHGSLMHFQCLESCGEDPWPVADELEVEVDEETLRALEPLPSCPGCGGMARPNILMFSDWGWDSSRSGQQGKRIRDWTSLNAGPRLAVIEIGAGTSIPTVRTACEEAWRASGGTFLRINPRECMSPKGALSLNLQAGEALRGIEEARCRLG